MEQYQEIEIDKIVTDGQMVRSGQDDDHIVELAMSISKHGLLEPIVVKEQQGGSYQLMAGYHRLLAFKKLNRTKIPAHIKKDGSASIKTIATIENIIRRDMSVEEEVNAVAHLNKEEHLSPSSICDLLGKSREWVNKRLMIPTLPEEVRAELMEGRISIGHAEVIGRLQDSSVRGIILNHVIMQKLTVRQTEEMAFLYEQTADIASAVEAGLEKKAEIQTPTPPQRTCDSCGRVRLLRDIQIVCVCADGCAPKEEKGG